MPSWKMTNGVELCGLNRRHDDLAVYAIQIGSAAGLESLGAKRHQDEAERFH
jgi:hypothetical protein